MPVKKSAFRYLLPAAPLAASMVTPLLAFDANAPHLEQRGSATQLIVDGKPFVMLSGELSNSTSSNLDYRRLGY